MKSSRPDAFRIPLRSLPFGITRQDPPAKSAPMV